MEQQEQQPTMDPTLMQLMQTLVAQSAAVQRLNQHVKQLSELLEACRGKLEAAEIELPKGVLPSKTISPEEEVEAEE